MVWATWPALAKSKEEERAREETPKGPALPAIEGWEGGAGRNPEPSVGVGSCAGDGGG